MATVVSVRSTYRLPVGLCVPERVRLQRAACLMVRSALLVGSTTSVVTNVHMAGSRASGALGKQALNLRANLAGDANLEVGPRQGAVTNGSDAPNSVAGARDAPGDTRASGQSSAPRRTARRATPWRPLRRGWDVCDAEVGGNGPALRLDAHDNLHMSHREQYVCPPNGDCTRPVRFTARP